MAGHYLQPVAVSPATPQEGEDKMEMNDINRLLAEKVMGWEDEYGDGIFYDNNSQYWNPLTDIAQAFMVVDKLLADGWNFDLLCGGDRKWYCVFFKDVGKYWETGFGAANDKGKTPAEAICRAAIKTTKEE